MGASRTAILLLLAGCSTTEPKPEAQRIFDAVSEAFLQATPARLEFVLEEKYLAPRELTLQGNDLVIFDCRSSRDGLYFSLISDGEDASLQTSRYRSGDLLKPPGNLCLQLKEGLLRGLFPDADLLYALCNIQRPSTPIVELFQHFKSFSAFVSGTDKLGRPTVSYDVSWPKSETRTSIQVTLAYDPTTFALLHLECSRQHLECKVYHEPPLPLGRFVVWEAEKRDLQKAKSDLATLREALEGYALDNNAYPTTTQGLLALRAEPEPAPRKWKGPYLKESDSLRDPWGNPYIYRSPRTGINPRGYDLWCLGPDGMPKTPDDIAR